MLCQMCNTNTAVLFINKMENGKPRQMALCLSCARKQGIPLSQLMGGPGGINQEELDNIGKQMNEMMEQMQEDGSLEGLEQMIPPQFLNMLKGATHPGEDDEDSDTETAEEDGAEVRASTDGSAPSGGDNAAQDPQQTKVKMRRKRNERLKTLAKFGTNLTDKAEDGEIDGVIGREKEIDRVKLSHAVGAISMIT